MKIIVLDTEVSGHNVGETAVGSFPANPFHPENWIVWLGMRQLNDQLETVRKTSLFRWPTFPATIPAIKRPAGEKMLIVGHNIKYDLECLSGPGNTKRDEWRALLDDPDVMLWDTQQAEFRLRGQLFVSPSMDKCCELRNWETKPGRLKEYWANGVSTEDIPPEEVIPYLTHDVDTTTALFLDQVEWARREGMMPLLRMENDAIMATTIMEVTGMWFDYKEALRVLDDEVEPQRAALLKELQEQFSEITGVPPEHINPSTSFMAAYLHGGVYKYKEQQLMYNDDGTPVLFKSGQRKGEHRKRWHTFEVELPRKVNMKTRSVDEEALLKMIAEGKVQGEEKAVLHKVLKLRGLAKQAKTYYRGYAGLTWRHDNLIHGSLNHAIAATARLTSSSPNLQNAEHGPIRKHFRSRYEGGHLLEVDLSQIEVVVQAFLSQDPTMIADILNGVDFHSKRAAFAAGTDYDTVREAYLAEDQHWTKKRKHAKVFSFQRAYGAGAPKIAGYIGIPVADVERLISAEEEMYPGIVDYQEQCIKDVNESCAPRDGIVCGELRICTGSKYRFQRESYRGRLGFKPTTIKNYPIQGMAGDILKLILGQLRRFLWDYNHRDTWDGTQALDEPVLMSMTVHDSVIFDVPAWVSVPQLAGELVELFVSAQTMLKDRLGVDFNVPIKADAEYGEDWYEMRAAA